MAVEYTLYVPLEYNDHSIVPQHVHDAIVARVLRLAGGCTVYPPARGLWRDDNGIVHDECVSLVRCIDTAQHALAWRALARDVCALLQQQSVLLTTATLATVEYVNPLNPLVSLDGVA